MKVNIYQPTKNAMQSGKRNSSFWLLEFDKTGTFTDPIMGWNSSRNTEKQLRMKFESKDLAVAYCERNNIEFTVIEPKKPKKVIRSYAQNFTS